MESAAVINQKGSLEMEYEDIIYTKENGIATLTLNRPDKMNAFTPGISAGIQRAVNDAAKDSEVRVLVITGTERAFCAGADVKTMAQQPDRSGGEERGRNPEAANVQLPVLLQKFEKPVIAAVNGVAVGGGLEPAISG
jgi:2-(1,2-epoxy-1,2-dihydrophenyl)acetyl-CoA isomerase